MGVRGQFLQLGLAGLIAIASHGALSDGALAQAQRGPKKPPIMLEETGAFEVGGKVISKPDDPKQTLSCDHGYVEYFIPAKRREAGVTGAAFMQKSEAVA